MKKLFGLFLLGITLLAAPSAAHADLIFANTTGGQLISFDSSAPGTILSQVAISGVAGNLVGIDFRPATPGELTGVGQSGGIGTVYRIDLFTGVATPVLTGFALTGTIFGVDFNPVPDALRIVSNTGQNLRITAGGAGVVNVDGNLNTAAPPVPQNPAQGVVAAAYTNPFAGATSTTLFVLRDTPGSPGAGPDQLFTQNPPNDGNLVNPVNLTINLGLAGFDINVDNQAFLSWNGGNQFGTLNLTTGQAVNFGAVGGGFAGQVAGISVFNGVPEPGSLTLLGLGAAGLVGYAWRRRKTAK